MVLRVSLALPPVLLREQLLVRRREWKRGRLLVVLLLLLAYVDPSFVIDDFANVALVQPKKFGQFGLLDTPRSQAPYRLNLVQ